MKTLQKLLGIGALTTGLTGLTGLVGNADAVIINVSPSTSPSTGIGVSEHLSLINDDSNTYTNSPFYSSNDTNDPSLEISSNDPGYRATQVVQPSTIDYFTFDLNVGPNSSSKIVGPVNEVLKFKVTDTTDLDGKTLLAHDNANLGVSYVIPAGGSLTLSQTSPACHPFNYVIQNQSNVSGGFDHWKVLISPYSADFNHDGVVDSLDRQIWLNNAFTGTTFAQGDANGDGSVNGLDRDIIMYCMGTPGYEQYNPIWNGGGPSPSPPGVPEPSTAWLLGIGAAAVGAYCAKRGIGKENKK